MNTADSNRTDAYNGERPSTRELKRILKTPGLVAFGLAYLVPLTVFTTFGVASRLTEGHVPTAYVITTMAMLFTALSYAMLVRELPSAGSAFEYAKQAFGYRIGVVTGWTLLLDYMLLPAINYLVIGIYLHVQFPHIPAPLFVLTAIALVTIANIVGIGTVRNVSLVLVAAQLAFAVIFVALAFARTDGVGSLLTIFYVKGMDWRGVFSGAAVLCLSFLGFDAISTLSEEARDPRESIPKAILMTTVIGGFIFMALSVASSLTLPRWTDIRVSDSAGVEVVAPLGSPFLVVLFLSTYIGGAAASAVASQASVSRILYAMGRDRVLPEAIFGVLSERFRTPVFSIVFVAALSCAVLLTTLDTLASIISFGALFAFSIVNLSVIKIFLVDRRHRGFCATLGYGVSPAVAFMMTSWLWLSLSTTSLIIGLIWLTAGSLYTLLLQRRGQTATRECQRS